MVPNPVLVSNAYIMEAVQPQTLEEPVGKSTILYANRFAGVQEVDVQDSTLLEILNSTIGTSGNNVLVQLKQKMKAYPGGPWYIDSNDGVVHVHNRKFTNKTAHVYTYMAEPGELLSASFRIVEVYKQDTAGLAAYVNAVNKTVSALLNPQVDNPPERPVTVSPEERRQDMNRLQRERLVQVPDNTRVDNTRVRIQMENYRVNQRIRQQNNAIAQRGREWSSKTPQQRQQVRNQYCNQAFNQAVDAGLEARVRQAPEYRNLIIKWDYYKQMCEEYGSNSQQAKKAWQEYKGAGADRAYISGISTKAYWDWHKLYLNVTNTYQSDNNVTGGRGLQSAEQSRQASIQRAINTWKNSHRGRFSGSVNIIDYGTWTTVKRRTFRYNTPEQRGDTYTQVTEKCRLTVQVYCLMSKPYKYPLSRLLGEYTSSGSGSVSNPLAAMQQAAANIGRGKKEKQLQATVRVVGNPELESTQQFTLQNVGKKYSGVWYIKTVTHVFEHGQGYTCDLELSKQQGKSKVSGTSDEINTRNYTSNGSGTTSKKGRPKANRIPSDNYTYQDAMNEQWTAEESLYIQHAVMSQPDETSARRVLEREAYNVADKNKYNHDNRANTQVVTMGNGTVNRNYSYKYRGVQRQKVRLPKQALDVLESYKRNRGK